MKFIITLTKILVGMVVGALTVLGAASAFAWVDAFRTPEFRRTNTQNNIVAMTKDLKNLI